MIIKMKDMKSLNKKQLREQINKLINLEREQMELMEQTFVIPYRKNIKLLQSILKNEVPIDAYIKNRENLSKHITELIGKKK